jgi:hypothetical protein
VGSTDKVDRFSREDLPHEKVLLQAEGFDARAKRHFPRTEEAEDRRPMDYNVFAGMCSEEFLFMSRIELNFSS